MKSFLTSAAKTLGLSRAQKSFVSTIAAAEQGNVEAQCIIAGCYKYGDDVEENHSEAARWFRIAAENGNTLAQRSLGFGNARGEAWKQTMLKRGSGIAWPLNKETKMQSPLLMRSEEHTSELQSRQYLVCRLLL